MAELHARSSDGVSVSALDEGRGPVLLVVHPGGSDTTTWDGVTRSLTEDFRVVRIRRRVYVPGAEPPRDHSMAVEAADILAITALLPPPVLLVGHSSGAVAALEAAVRSPGAFSGLFLYEPPLPTRSPVAGEAGRRARAALDAGDPAEAMRIHLRDIVRMPAAMVDGLFEEPGARAALSFWSAAQIADNEAIDALGTGTARYTTLSPPVTLIEGDLSPAHLRERSADLAAALPSARVLTLAGHGHVAHLTAPELLAAAIRETAARVLC